MNIGDLLPDILGTDQHGRLMRRSDWEGQKFILYFYPKDNTPGCTAEACSLRDHYEALRNKGYAVVGVSADSADSHRRFAEKHNLPFPLLADTDKSLIQAMGVWGEKNMYGRRVMGLLRTTFLIGPDGRVEHIFSARQVKTKIHAQQILALLEA